MSKTTSKLASGIRKVKEQQSAPAARKPPPRQPAATRPAAADAARPRRPGDDNSLHPARIWPD
jgi:hypothetical protein